MPKRRRILALIPLSLAALSFAGDPAPALVKSGEIALEGEPRFDYVTVDPDAGRLYVAHNPKIDVIDLKKGLKVGEVDGVDGAHGTVVLPELNRGFSTAGMKGKLVVFDLGTLKTAKEIETGQGPDAILYVPSTKEVWTFNGKGRSVTCVDASSLQVTATITLEGQPEAGAADAEKDLVYLDLEDKSAVCVIDAKQHKVVSTHPVAPGEEPSGIALDAKDGLLFIGCGNRKLVALSTETWAAVASFDIGEHCDGTVFDPETGNAFASCRGRTGACHVRDAKTVEPLPSLDTPGGKTCALDPKTHALYVASGPKRGEKGTLKVLVFSPK